MNIILNNNFTQLSQASETEIDFYIWKTPSRNLTYTFLNVVNDAISQVKR